MRTRAAVAAGTLLMLLWAPAPRAAGARDSTGTRAGAPPLSLHLSWERPARADFDGTAASVASTEYSARASWLFLELDVEHREMAWERGWELGAAPARDPWTSFTSVSPGVQYYHEFGRRWGIWAEYVATAGFEANISSRCWSHEPQLVGVLRPRERMRVFAGAGALYLRVESIVYPVLGVAWEAGSPSGASGALGFPETMLRYPLGPRFALKADLQWDIRAYRLADGNSLAALGYARTRELRTGMHLEYSPAAPLRVTTGVRLLLARELGIYDSDATELADYELGETWSFRCGLERRLP